MESNRETTITRIDKRSFKGKVYNLKVEEDESYTANNILVHNCRSRITFHPTPPKRTSEAEVKAVKAWDKDGIGVTEIGRMLKRPNTTIYNILGRIKGLK